MGEVFFPKTQILINLLLSKCMNIGTNVTNQTYEYFKIIGSAISFIIAGEKIRLLIILTQLFILIKSVFEKYINTRDAVNS